MIIEIFVCFLRNIQRDPKLGIHVRILVKSPKKREAICFPLWCHQESNRGHMDFQSIALPTELWHHFESGADLF